MKTLREMMDQIDEISRRDVLRGAGAAALGAATGGAEADRGWRQDPISNEWDATMTSENWRGAELNWEGERKIVSIGLTESTNFSMNNVERKRLHYPKITSPRWIMKNGSNPPFSGNGQIYTFPMRQLGDYTGSGIILFSGKMLDKVRDDFINAEQVAVRLEIDGRPQTIIFNDNPELIRIRRQAAQAQKEQDDAELEKKRREQLQRLVGPNVKEDSLEEASPEALVKIDELTGK